MTLRLPLLAGCLAFVAASLLILLQPPGLTIDEPINASHGKALVDQLQANPVGVLDGETVLRLWRNGHDHPPLTRLLIGVSQTLAGVGDAPFANPLLGRFASAAAWGLIVFLVWRLGDRLGEPPCGAASSLACVLMPRLWGHAELASPEVISSAFLLAALVGVSRALQPFAKSPPPASDADPPVSEPTPGRWRTWLGVAAAGVLLGLAVLTKMTVVLLPIGVILGALVRLRGRGILPLLVWGAVGVLTFFVVWPWLWPVDVPGHPEGLAGTLHRLKLFLTKTLDRQTLYVWYLGQRYASDQVPWHFFWVYFAVTVPLVVHVGGLIGLARLAGDAAVRWHVGSALLLAVLGLSAVFFTLPGHRYDAERLFLFLFPLWAVVAGIGWGGLWRAARRPWLVATAVVLLTVPSGVQAARVWPYWLCYYDVTIGGLDGAADAGLEIDYWGVSLGPAILGELAEHADAGDEAVLVPTLFAGHAAFLTSPELEAKRVRVIPQDQLEEADRCRWVLLFHRRGYLVGDVAGEGLAERIQRSGPPVAEVSRDGAWLARIYALPEDLGGGRP